MLLLFLLLPIKEYAEGPVKIRGRSVNRTRKGRKRIPERSESAYSEGLRFLQVFHPLLWESFEERGSMCTRKVRSQWSRFTNQLACARECPVVDSSSVHKLPKSFILLAEQPEVYV